ncbi:MAG: hypothetical protein R1F52_04420 [Candidatus Nitrosoabyssus spongiisocia]|nr:MAG: hypothetical protein R1F52_04420 [Nitrosopumilaceae archaeon AB1(1)]
MNELNIEQFIYTSTHIKKSGYQIVAQSEGITRNIISQLKLYMYPIGVELKFFKESRSLVLLEDDLVAYSRIKNVGIGHDGRSNTLYNHTMIISKNDFKKCNNDSRIFDEYYREDRRIRKLSTLRIDSKQVLNPTNLNIAIPLLNEILYSIFTDKKIAILLDDPELPQKIIAFLPISMRLISFSTHVVDPNKQSKYNFILNAKLNKFIVNEDYKIISPDKISQNYEESSLKKSVSDYVNWIIQYDHKKIQEIHDLFEKNPGDSNKNKLILATNYIQFKESLDKEQKSQCANNILEILKEFNPIIFKEYFDKIKNSLEKYQKIEDMKLPQIDSFENFNEALFYYSKYLKNIVILFEK